MDHAWLLAHDKQDALCLKCQDEEGMLCGGLRPVFDLARSEESGGFATGHQFCEKARHKSVVEAMAARVKRACVPTQVAFPIIESEDYPLVEVHDSKFFVDNTAISDVSKCKASIETTRRIFALVIGACVSGLAVKYISPSWWYRQPPWTWEDLGFDDCFGAEIVIVDRLDAMNGSDVAREQMFSMVASRISSYQLTIVTLSETPKGKNDMEIEILTEAMRWPNF